MKTSAIKKALSGPRRKRFKIKASDYLSSGATLLNCAVSGNPFRCFLKGHYHYFVGDSSSGKTFLVLTCLAEACRNKHFNGYRLIYDNSEDGALMDIEKFFGKDVAERLEPPGGYDEDGEPINSVDIEDMYDFLDDLLRDGRPFIYIEDSMDALTSKYERKKFKEQKAARKKGLPEKGDFGDGKAKINSRNIRRVKAGLRKTGSILILISQSRDKIDAGPFEEKSTRSGGRSLKFYAACEMWCSIVGRIKKTVRGKKRQTGINARVRVKKNRFNGKEREVVVPMYWSYGIDDVGSCVDYLTDEGHWSKCKGGFNAHDINFKGSRAKIIAHVEKNNLQKDLSLVVGQVWDEIENELSLDREKRYV